MNTERGNGINWYEDEDNNSFQSDKSQEITIGITIDEFKKILGKDAAKMAEYRNSVARRRLAEQTRINPISSIFNGKRYR